MNQHMLVLLCLHVHWRYQTSSASAWAVCLPAELLLPGQVVRVVDILMEQATEDPIGTRYR
jgi:hypothetical protein